MQLQRILPLLRNICTTLPALPGAASKTLRNTGVSLNIHTYKQKFGGFISKSYRQRVLLVQVIVLGLPRRNLNQFTLTHVNHRPLNNDLILYYKEGHLSETKSKRACADTPQNHLKPKVPYLRSDARQKTVGDETVCSRARFEGLEARQ